MNAKILSTGILLACISVLVVADAVEELIHSPDDMQPLHNTDGNIEDAESHSKTFIPKHKDIVVFSTTVDNLYFFFTPITAILWSDLMQYTPLVFVVVPEDYETEKRTKQKNKIIEYVLNKTEEAGGLVVTLPHSSVYSDAVIAQVSRLYAAMLEWPENSYLLTSDVDMWPLSYSHFHQRQTNKKVQLYYANAYQHLKDEIMYPICYIGAEPDTWQDIMKLESNKKEKDIYDTIIAQLDAAIEEYGKDEWDKPGYGLQWFYDQKLFGKRIGAWKGHPKDCQKINRQPDYQFLADRLDRGRWNFKGTQDLQKYVDAHLLRPGTEEKNWNELKFLLEELANHNTTLLNWVTQYRRRYMRMGGGEKN